MAGEHDGHRQRMKERFRKNGLEGFAPHEVLELLLFYAIPRGNVNEIAHRLEDHFGSFHAVFDAPVEDLCKVAGIGKEAATFLTIFSPLHKQIEKSRIGNKVVLQNRSAAEAHCIRLLSNCRSEHFYVICLDAQMRVISNVLIAKGTLTEVPAYPRVIIEEVLRYNAHAVLLCHNHPGGSTVPSQGDIEATTTISNLLQGLGVSTVDHLIVAEGSASSMMKYDLMEKKMTVIGSDARVADSAGEVRIRKQLQKKFPKNTEDL